MANPSRANEEPRLSFKEFAIQGPTTSSLSSSEFIGFECADLKADKDDPKKPAKIKAVKTFYEESSDAGPQLQQSQQFQSRFQFQTVTDDRIKKKGQKRVGKKAKPQSLIGMFNYTLGRYDFSMFIRKMRQSNKVNITWMNQPNVTIGPPAPFLFPLSFFPFFFVIVPTSPLFSFAAALRRWGSCLLNMGAVER